MNSFHILTTFVSSLIKIADEARLIGNPAALLLQATSAAHGVTAVLTLPRSNFLGFPPCPRTYIDGINLNDLQVTLAPSHQEHSMSIHFNMHQRIVRFTFLGPNNAVRNSEIQLIDPPNFPNLADAIFEYAVLVGIPSPTFQYIMSYLNGITAHNQVVVSITQTGVRFSSGNIAITCTTENEGCIIIGMEGRNGIVAIRICKFSINALLEASRLCGTVWLCKSLSNLAPNLVYCYAGLLGGMKFYYISSFPIPVEPSHPRPNPRIKRRKLQHDLEKLSRP
ncbi:Proliferating cell nuclear antigen like [Actinidia chinensis var. chinensis]|uniref:Proliferating cell nuclear antigen like n=1 Tax=Actinidia chinensis var. chinensis TaxID=1590841 RepID=A0A2R6QKY7_ACTCC|nr:Proliferating cell nuclear antigen like [Actinidia chinensis var. chinensis]